MCSWMDREWLGNQELVALWNALSVRKWAIVSESKLCSASTLVKICSCSPYPPTPNPTPHAATVAVNATGAECPVPRWGRIAKGPNSVHHKCPVSPWGRIAKRPNSAHPGMVWCGVYPLTAVPPIYGDGPFQWNSTSRSHEAVSPWLCESRCKVVMPMEWWPNSTQNCQRVWGLRGVRSWRYWQYLQILDCNELSVNWLHKWEKCEP